MPKLKHANLEKAANDFLDKIEGATPIYKMTPQEARDTLEKVQTSPEQKLPVKSEEVVIDGPYGKLSLRIVRPPDAVGTLPVVMFYHGAGWVMGSASTHDRLVREIAVGSDAAVVFVNYTRSPEAQFPQAIEESYFATQYIYDNGKKYNLDTSRLAVVGDSVGGNMTIAITLLAKRRKGPKIDLQVLFYPVTNGELTSGSYNEFAEGYWLSKPAMEWFWNQYEPNKAKRTDPLISPLKASIEELKGLPSALIITDENDVLRDEGEAYAHRLMEAEVPVVAVRVLGTIHDFLMLNDLGKSHAAKGAITLATAYLTKVLHP